MPSLVTDDDLRAIGEAERAGQQPPPDSMIRFLRQMIEDYRESHRRAMIAFEFSARSHAVMQKIAAAQAAVLVVADQMAELFTDAWSSNHRDVLDAYRAARKEAASVAVAQGAVLETAAATANQELEQVAAFLCSGGER